MQGECLLIFAIVSHKIKLRARDALELGGAFRAGKVVADAKRVTFEFVDRRKSLAAIHPIRAGNGHALRLGGGIDRVSTPVGFVSNENFILTVVQFEADDLQDSVSHGLPGQLRLGGLPFSLNRFAVVGRVGSEHIQ